MATDMNRTNRSSIRVWSSYSCNNSSSFRLVARFETPARAKEAADDLRAFLEEATPLAEHRTRRGHKVLPLTAVTKFPATERMDALAIKYGFDWSDLIVTGVYNDEMEIVSEGPTAVVFHPYCLGLGDALPTYFNALGAAIETQRSTSPTISVVFDLPSANVRSELETLFLQAETKERIYDWEIKPPWSGDRGEDGLSKETAFFCDGKTFGFYIPINPAHLPAMREWLQNAGVINPSIRLCEYADRDKFKKLHAVKCASCGGTLRLLDRHEHGIDADQLACISCGGMYDYESFKKEE